MKKDKTKQLLEYYLQLATSTDECIAVHNRKADGLLTLSIMVLCYPIYELIRGEEMKVMYLLLIALGSFCLGFSIFLKLSSSSMKILGQCIDVEAINKQLNDKHP